VLCELWLRLIDNKHKIEVSGSPPLKQLCSSVLSAQVT
jgi:hypothetical protein